MSVRIQLHQDNPNVIDYMPTTDTPGRSIVQIGTNLVGYVNNDIPANELGAVTIGGAIRVPIKTGETVAVGDAVYWLEADKAVSKTKGAAGIPLGVVIPLPQNKPEVSGWAAVMLRQKDPFATSGG